MLGLIEQRFGYPTEQELQDLVFFYPKEIDHDIKLNNNQLTDAQQSQHDYRLQYFRNLLKAFLSTHKKRQFQETRALDAPENIDAVRVKYLQAHRGKLNYIRNDIVPDALKFIVKLLRYSPQSRPTSRQSLADEFFRAPLNGEVEPLQYTPVDVAQLPAIKEMYQ